MNTCSTCKHWDRSSHPMPMSEKEYHVCNGVPIGIAILALEHMPSTDQVLSTSAEFGCPKWEKRSDQALLEYLRYRLREAVNGRVTMKALAEDDVRLLVELLEKDVG